MKPITRRRKNLWECHVRGHRPMGNSGDENMIYNLDGVRHIGRICSHCKCAYFEQLGEDEGRIIKV